MRCVRKILTISGALAIMAALLLPSNVLAQEVEGGILELHTVYSTSEVRRTGVTACGGSTQLGGNQGAATYIGYVCYSGGTLYLGYSTSAQNVVPQSITVRISNSTSRLIPYTEVGTYNLIRTSVRAHGFQQYALAVSSNPLSTGAAFKIEVFEGATTDNPLKVHFDQPLANNQIVVYGVEEALTSGCRRAGYSATIAGSSAAEPIYNNQVSEVYYRNCIGSTSNDGLYITFGGAITGTGQRISVWLDGVTRYYTVARSTAIPTSQLDIIPPGDFNAVGSLLYQQPMIIGLAASNGRALDFRAPPPPATPQATSKYGESLITDFAIRSVSVFRTTYEPDPVSYQTVAPYSLVFLMSYEMPASFEVDTRACVVLATLYGVTYAANGTVTLDALGSTELLRNTANGSQQVQRLRPLVQYEVDEETNAPFYYLEGFNGKGRGLIYGEIIPRPNISFTGVTATQMAQEWHVNGNQWYENAPASHTTNGNPVIEWQLECNIEQGDGTYAVTTATLPREAPRPLSPGSTQRLDTFESFKDDFYRHLLGSMLTMSQVWDKQLVKFDGTPSPEGELVLRRLIPNFDDVFTYLEKYGVTSDVIRPTATPAPRPQQNPNNLDGSILADPFAATGDIATQWNIPRDAIRLLVGSIPAIILLVLLLVAGHGVKAFNVAAAAELIVATSGGVIGIIPWQISGIMVVLAILAAMPFVAKRIRD